MNETSNQVNIETKNMNCTSNQVVAGHNVTIIKNKAGMRAARIDFGVFVPVEMLSLTAGKDVWMRQILLKCSECRTVHPAGALNGGGQDVCCDACLAKFEAENEAENS
jgi:hypothetical protein